MSTKPIKLTGSEKQFLLYTKGHFEKGEDLIEDVKVFAANNFGLYIEHTSWSNAMNFVVRLFDDLIEAGYIRTEGKSPTEYLLSEILHHNLQRDDNSLLKFMIGRMQFTNVAGLDLPEASSSYMKLRIKESV